MVARAPDRCGRPWGRSCPIRRGAEPRSPPVTVTPGDPYRLLGLEPGASAEQVRAAFREKVRRSHPDTAVSAEAGAGVQEIVEAYRLLMDPEARARHDSSSSGAGAWLGGDRVTVRHAARKPDDLVTERVCRRCHGTGVEVRDVICSGCRGRGEATALYATPVRVVPCQRCSGRGWVSASRQCPACGGSGGI